MLGVAEVLDYHRKMVATLGYQRNAYGTATTDPHGPFFSFDPDEYEAALSALRDELDKEVVLTLVASAEAAIRTDFAERVRRRTRDAVRKELGALRKNHGDRVRLDDILKAWKGACYAGGDSFAQFAQFGQLLKHRHWLAHGRHWSDKSGVLSDPETVAQLVESLYARLQGAAANFPLS